MKNNFSETTSSNNNVQYFDLTPLTIKTASILAHLYLDEKDDDNKHGNGDEQYFFYNHDYSQIPEDKVLRIRIDIVSQKKAFKKKK